MKKTATKISGILTLIFSIILLLFSAIILALKFEINFVSELLSSSQVLSAGITLVSSVYVAFPVMFVKTVLSGVSANLLTTVFVSMLFAFLILMVFWGIKEIVISHRDDVDFAGCKKTCGFMFFTKFMFFLYTAFALASPFLFKTIKTEVSAIDLLFVLALNIKNAFLIFTGVVAIISLILFLLPVINVGVVAKKVRQDSANNKMAGEEFIEDANGINSNQDAQELDQFYKSTPQPTMQANMPPLPGFNSSISTYQVQNEQNSLESNNQENNTNQNQISQNAQQNSNFDNQSVFQSSVVPPQSIQQDVNSQQTINTQANANIQPTNTNLINGSLLVSGQNAQASVQNVNNNITNQNMSNLTSENIKPNVVNSTQNSTAVQEGSVTSGVQSETKPLSEKAQADLDRLERLKNMGAITPENYEAMKKKILDENN